jgi:hypothetical protein
MRADVVADISASALGGAGGGGLLHDRGLDAPRVSHVLHGLRDRMAVAARPHPRLDAASERGLHAPDRTSVHRPNRPRRRRAACPDLRPRSEVEHRRSAAARDVWCARVIQTPYRAPNCNAHAERFVRSLKEECLNRVIPLGEGHVRRTLAEFVVHYHRERNHQGLGNELIDGNPDARHSGAVRRRQRIGGLLSFYHRAA